MVTKETRIDVPPSDSPCEEVVDFLTIRDFDLDFFMVTVVKTTINHHVTHDLFLRIKDCKGDLEERTQSTLIRFADDSEGETVGIFEARLSSVDLDRWKEAAANEIQLRGQALKLKSCSNRSLELRSSSVEMALGLVEQ
ncbi:hypothetical protein BTVI_08775 [Pitangus sulphuratus]|nr:hypothetical protein BTVI_08775 [Pitangus sulphuratus]